MDYIENEIKSLNIDSTQYIQTELIIINRYKAKHKIDINTWIDNFALKYHNAVKKFKTLNIGILEKEIYKEGVI